MQLKKPVLSVALVGMMIAASPAAVAVTIDFETTPEGTPTLSDTPVGADYGALGAVFSDAFYKACGGGCPTPELGRFISSSNFLNPFSITFAGTAQSFSFANVSFSAGTARAFGVGGDLLETIEFASSPARFSFTTGQIGSVSFSGSPFGVDDFTFELAQGVGAVPEPATWAMLLLGFGFVGSRMRAARRRQATAVSYA